MKGKLSEGGDAVRYHRFFLLWIGMIFVYTRCVNDFIFFRKLPPPKKPPEISYSSTAENIDRELPLLPPPEPTLKRFIDRNLFEIIGVASLLLFLNWGRTKAIEGNWLKY